MTAVLGTLCTVPPVTVTSNLLTSKGILAFLTDPSCKWGSHGGRYDDGFLLGCDACNPTVHSWVDINVSEKHTVSIFRAKERWCWEVEEFTLVQGKGRLGELTNQRRGMRGNVPTVRVYTASKPRTASSSWSTLCEIPSSLGGEHEV
jgi:hypothetical protein